MTSKERVLATLTGKKPDLMPWGEHSIDYNIYEMILGRPSLCHAKFHEHKAYWEGRRDEIVESSKRDYVDLIRALDMDITTVTKVHPKGFIPVPPKLIGENIYQDEAGRIYKYSPITHDLMPYPMNTSYFNYNITMDEICEKVEQAKALPPVGDEDDSCYELVQHVVNTLGDTHFIITPINGIEWPRFGTNDEESYINLIEEPEICKKIAEYQYLLTIRELDKIKSLGVDGVLSVGDLGHTNSLAASPVLYRQIILPYHKLIYKECKKRGLYVMRHCCGHVWPIIDDIIENNDSYEGIQELAGMDLTKLKEYVGDRLNLWGGVLHEHIHAGTVEQVTNDIKRTAELSKKYGGIIMGSSHSLTLNAKYDTIMAMKNAREQYGG